jgi:hypothetical protein
MVKNPILKQVIRKLENVYGDLDKACGCTVLCKDEEYKLFSTKIVKEVIEEIDDLNN